MTEIGGPTTQAGIRFQDRVAALYLGRMLDPRERPSRDRPMEVRVETSDAVDDLVVRFDDGSRHFFQAKLALQRRGKAWESLWRALYRQFTVDLSRDDRLVLVMGDSTALTSDLKELVARTDSVAPVQWLERLTTQQREIASSIARVLAAPGAEVFRLFCHLDVHVWPAKELARDYAPLWMPPEASQLHSCWIFWQAWFGRAQRRAIVSTVRRCAIGYGKNGGLPLLIALCGGWHATALLLRHWRSSRCRVRTFARSQLQSFYGLVA